MTDQAHTRAKALAEQAVYWAGHPQCVEHITAAIEAYADEIRQEAESRLMDELSGQAWCQGIRPAIKAADADEFVSKVLEAVHEDRAHVSVRFDALTTERDRLRAALMEVERHCPCGARSESPQTHPHVISCPVGAALSPEDR